MKEIPSKLVESNSMYVSEAKIYPREVTGRYQRLRNIAAWVLMGLFYLMPWVNLFGEQALLFDLPKRQFHVLGLNFWPQDFIFLSGILVVLALSLFFFTALAGRLWCGYACPQTVWTEVFLALERMTEGDRGHRMKLDKAPWSWNKLRRKGLKQLSWIVLSVWTGMTFVGFFSPIRELLPNLLTGAAGGWELFWIGFYGLATYGNAGYLREQVCKYMCPYARFQSAMFDHDTLVISYDTTRGEQRGPGKRQPRLAGAPISIPNPTRSAVAVAGEVAATSQGFNLSTASTKKLGLLNLGDCIDCTLCVQVCPTGIDIRDGLQIDCIACGACIDACDSVMTKIGLPVGLVRYSTENAMASKPTRILRPRIIIYGMLLLTLFAILGAGLVARKPLLVDVLRDRNALYRVVGDGEIENSYTLKITNKAAESRRFLISLDAPSYLQLLDSAQEVALKRQGKLIEVPARSTQAYPVTVRMRSADAIKPGLSSRTHIKFAVSALDQPDLARTEESWFFAPTELKDAH